MWRSDSLRSALPATTTVSPTEAGRRIFCRCIPSDQLSVDQRLPGLAYRVVDQHVSG
jgi:hypothetical protein